MALDRRVGHAAPLDLRQCHLTRSSTSLLPANKRTLQGHPDPRLISVALHRLRSLGHSTPEGEGASWLPARAEQSAKSVEDHRPRGQPIGAQLVLEELRSRSAPGSAPRGFERCWLVWRHRHSRRLRQGLLVPARRLRTGWRPPRPPAPVSAAYSSISPGSASRAYGSCSSEGATCVSSEPSGSICMLFRNSTTAACSLRGRA